MLSLVLAAALTAAAPAHVPGSDVRIVRSTNPRTRYVRISYDVRIAGVHGTETTLFDLATGRGTERVSAGPLSYGDGFDGIVTWTSDATGMPLVDDTPDSHLDGLAWAHFFGRRGPERPSVRRLRAERGSTTLRFAYPGLSGPIDVTLDRERRVERVEDRTGLDATVSRLRDYRRVGDVVLPFDVEGTSRYGTTREHVRGVEFPRSVPARAFAPPAPPRDAVLDGMTAVPMRLVDNAPIVAIRINGGPAIHVLFDSGASNTLTPRTARRLGLVTRGGDFSGGMGAGLVRQRYTQVKRVQIGAAVMTDQPFVVLDDDLGGVVDGIIGCEVLQRFAARFDFAGRRVDLVRDAAMFLIASPSIPMHLSGCTPEIDGALDGMRGPVAIDTGSGNSFDVMAPFVRRHKLVTRYRASRLFTSGAGIGGKTLGYEAFAERLRLGNVTIPFVPITLSAMRAGALTDPTELGNAGVGAFGSYVTVFDYRGRRMWLLR